MNLWVKLIDSYGIQWCLDIFDFITKQEKRGPTQSIIIKDFSKLIQRLSKHTNCHEVITWLMHYQFMSIKLNHREQLNSRFYTDNTLPDRINELTDLILGVIACKDKSSHLKVLEYIMKNQAIYPQLSFVKLFEIGIRQLKSTEAESLGYKAFLNYLYVSLTNEYQLGLRRIDDWSLRDPLILY